MKRRPILWGFITALIVLTLVYLVVKGISKPARTAYTSSSIFGGEGVGVVEIEGAIFTAKQWLEDLKALEDNSEVRAIVLRINSPGGSVGTAQEIYREVNRLRAKKPVVASIENVGASAAYYIACASNKIVVNPGSLAGSIGVIYINFNLRELYRWAKVQPEVIKSGKFKDIGSTFRDLTNEERKLLEDMLVQLHQQFVNDVAKGRNLDVAKVSSIADGRALTGEQAVKLGLADEFGNFNDAVKIAAQLGGVKGEPRVIYPKRKPRWEMFFKMLSDVVVSKMLELNAIPMYELGVNGGVQE